MTNEELALEFTKILAPTINAECAADDKPGIKCLHTLTYYEYFLEYLNRNDDENSK